MATKDHDDAPERGVKPAPPVVKPAPPEPPDRRVKPEPHEAPAPAPTPPVSPEEQAAINAHQETIVKAYHDAKAAGDPEAAPTTKAEQDALK